MATLHLLAGQALPHELSPQRIGYRRLPIIDAHSRMVGDRPVPALLLKGALPVLLFPQLTLRLLNVPTEYPYREATLDFLVLVRVQGKNIWINLDIKGAGHEDGLDALRDQLLALPRLVVTPTELARPDFLPWLRKNLEERARQSTNF